jgi:hypothetical protein
MLHGQAFRSGILNTNVRARIYTSRDAGRHLPVTQLSATSSDGGAGGGDNSEAVPAAPSLGEAYSLLGLKEGSSYETVLNAKNRLMERYRGQREKLEDIERAYDTIFSSQLKARLSGDLPVSNKVRFADVAHPRRQGLGGAPKPLTLPGNAVAVRKLPNQAAVTTSAVFAALAAWTLAQGILWHDPGKADVPGLQLALGTATAVYALREGKKVQLAKSAGIAFAGLVVGALVGSGVESWLRVDLIPLGALSSPSTVVGEFALLGVWAAVLFLA